MSLQTRWLQHLIDLCDVGQKAHAWHQAKHLAEICPDQLSELPLLLTSHQLSLSSEQSATDTKGAEK